MRAFVLTGLIVTVIFTACGCGGGGNGTPSVTPVATDRKGSATFRVTWPNRSRLIPAASNSISVVIKLGTTVVAQTLLPRPASGGTSSASFATLPIGTLSATASAYPNTDGSGTAQASATSPLVIQAGQNTSIGLTMNSTIDHLTLSPSPAVAIVGTPLLMSVTAYDVNGNVVLLSSPKLQWASSSTNIATVSSIGVVSGLVAGTSTISVTDTESGKTASQLISARVISPITFGSPTLYSVTNIPQEIMIGDMDGDGKMDIVVGTQSDLEILYGKGDGSFEPAKVILTWTGGISPWSLADMNGDGTPDITCTVSNQVVIVPNLCGRSFGSPTAIPIANQISGFVVARFTGGTLPDFSVVSHVPYAYGATILTFKNNGGLNFTQISSFGVGDIVIWLDTADLNGDGKPDLMVSAITDIVGTSGAALFYNDGTGHFVAGPYINTTTSNVLQITAGDLLGNGRQDLVVANDTSQNISVVMNTGGNTYGTPAIYGLENPDHIRIADMDGDGKPDLVIGDRDPTYFTVLRNVNGVFPNQLQFQTGGSNFGGFAVGDLNGDGKPDVVVAMQFSGQVSVVLNTTPW